MEKLILFALLTVFFTISISAQIEKSELSTKIIKLNFVAIPASIVENQQVADSEDIKIPTFEQKTLRNIFSKVLSERGAVEFDRTGKFLIVTETEARLNLFVEFMRILDNSGFSFNELFLSATEKNESIVTETIKTKNLFPIMICYGFAGPPNGIYDPPVWASEQGLMLTEISAQMKLAAWKSETKRQVEVTGSEKRVALFKQLIELFDRPFLEKEFKY